MFANRISAARLLAPRLRHLRDKAPVVLALPRGGVPLGAVIAEALGAPLGLMLVRKLGAPGQPELAIGAVADAGSPLVKLERDSMEELGASPSYIAAEQARQWQKIESQRRLYGASAAPALRQKTVILVDDGIATGATMLAAIAAVRRQGASEIIVAVPVAPPDSLARLEAVADQVICLEVSEHFFGVGAFYDDFSQVTDEEVRGYLQRASPQHQAGRFP